MRIESISNRAYCRSLNNNKQKNFVSRNSTCDKVTFGTNFEVAKTAATSLLLSATIFSHKSTYKHAEKIFESGATTITRKTLLNGVILDTKFHNDKIVFQKAIDKLKNTYYVKYNSNEKIEEVMRKSPSDNTKQILKLKNSNNTIAKFTRIERGKLKTEYDFDEKSLVSKVAKKDLKANEEEYKSNYAVQGYLLGCFKTNNAKDNVLKFKREYYPGGGLMKVTQTDNFGISTSWLYTIDQKIQKITVNEPNIGSIIYDSKGEIVARLHENQMVNVDGGNEYGTLIPSLRQFYIAHSS